MGSGGVCGNETGESNQIEERRERKRIPGGTAETKGRLRGQK